ncbi:MAG: GTPase [Candidatus Cloacimonetes bacterium]|nr:GTPase [Candidatus Cloacimonadota bacterium]
MNTTRFHFIYNADSGLLNTTLDIAHKILSPSTYKCDLCQLTHGILSEQESLTEFKKEFPDKILFYHKDDRLPKGSENGPFPSIWIEKDDTLSLFLPPDQISKLKNIKEILNLITTHL